MLVYYFISIFVYIKQSPYFLFIVLLCFLLNMFYHVTSLCVSIIFISRPIFMRTSLLYQSNDILIQFSFVLLSRRGIYPINNIRYSQQSMQTFMLAGFVSSDCYSRKIIFKKYIRHAMLVQFLADMQC